MAEEKYPEHEKLRAQMDTQRIVQSFIDFLFDEFKVDARNADGEEVKVGIHAAYYTHTLEEGIIINDDYWDEYHATLAMTDSQRARIIWQFLGVDPDKLEEEKCAMLEEIWKAL